MSAALKSAAAELSVLPARRGKTRMKRMQLHSRSRESTSTPLTSPSVSRASPAGMCFDAACQATQDRAFVAAVLFPLAASVAAGAFVWNQPSRSPPPSRSSPPSPSPSSSSSLSDRGSSPPPQPPPPSDSATADGGGQRAVAELFEDPSSGVVFEARPGERPPERDGRGELAYRVASFTPSPVEEGSGGDRVRVEVGDVAARAPRTYVFERRLPQPSRVIAVSLARPAGVVLAESRELPRGGGKAAVVVDQLLAGSPAARRAAAASLDPSLRDSAVLPGDLLRGFTTTNFVFRGAGALLGVAAPSREAVVFGADGQGWKGVLAALGRGSASDGDLTLIVERRE